MWVGRKETRIEMVLVLSGGDLAVPWTKIGSKERKRNRLEQEQDGLVPDSPIYFGVKGAC